MVPIFHFLITLASSTSSSLESILGFINGTLGSIDSFSKEATLWNKNHFGNILYKKKQILARLYGIQKALSNNPCASLFTLENQLHQDLDHVLDQERDLWLLNSRVNWMIQGNRNTSFYPMSTLTRRKRNHIASVKDERGEWITSER